MNIVNKYCRSKLILKLNGAMGFAWKPAIRFTCNIVNLTYITFKIQENPTAQNTVTELNEAQFTKHSKTGKILGHFLSTESLRVRKHWHRVRTRTGVRRKEAERT